uniref:Uncharacterized protein n=1 Tax=Candidatus Methanogaster sp. ANME-2c ERB4 TaxID=2759911 RepID=A0A7G9YPA8_9EURY|nr:hypothetical protein HMIKAMFF_00002 [Methanosarcinales archaeon ANME-2c ERB4]
MTNYHALAIPWYSLIPFDIRTEEKFGFCPQKAAILILKILSAVNGSEQQKKIKLQ